jgi:ElaB/YqjD/DUF883 family membrane-anchored ribosome-binding protein
MELENSQIQNDIDQTRADLADKLTSLEARVTDGLQMTSEILTDTVSGIRSAARSVGETLDPALQIQRHPWPAFIAACAVGAIVGYSTRPKRRVTTDDQVQAEDIERQTVNRQTVSKDGSRTLLTVLGGALIQGVPVLLDWARAVMNAPPVTAEAEEQSDAKYTTVFSRFKANEAHNRSPPLRGL